MTTKKKKTQKSVMVAEAEPQKRIRRRGRHDSFIETYDGVMQIAMESPDKLEACTICGLQTVRSDPSLPLPEAKIKIGSLFSTIPLCCPTFLYVPSTDRLSLEYG
jgi:hypothetical protein